MKNTIISLLILFFLISIIGILLSGCVDSGLDIDSIDSAVYRFQDSSVDPYYHRSYTITITESEVSISVDVYGDIIAEKNYSIVNEDFEHIKTVIKNAGVSNTTYPENPGCAGGKGESLSFYVKEELFFSGDVYHCGGSDSGNLGGDLESIQAALTALIPDFEELLAIEYLK